MKLDKVLYIIVNRPSLFVVTALIYTIFVSLLKWNIHPTIDTLFFVSGCILGVYLTDIVDVFINVSPSPFRTIVFVVLFVIVSFFIISSVENVFAQGIVLSMYLMLVLFQIGELKSQGNLNSWYKVIAQSVSIKSQQLNLLLLAAFFILETYLFIR